MSEDLVYCIRGCVRPCDCTECLIADKPIHPPIEREAAEGSLLCQRCERRIEDWLREIPELYATLDVTERRQAEDAGVGKGKSHKAPGSPALARLDIVALQDPRTTAGLPGDPWDGSIYIPGELATWAQLLAEENNITSRTSTLTEACGLLLRWTDRVFASPWVDELYDALRDVMLLLRQAHGATGRKPVGKCINVYQRDGETIACDAMLYAPAEGVQIRCRRCGTRYDGQRMLLVKMQEQRDREGA